MLQLLMLLLVILYQEGSCRLLQRGRTAGCPAALISTFQIRMLISLLRPFIGICHRVCSIINSKEVSVSCEVHEDFQRVPFVPASSWEELIAVLMLLLGLWAFKDTDDPVGCSPGI